MKKILWLDTETTGLSPKKHGLREVAFIAIVDDEIVGKEVLFINPSTYKKDVEYDPKALEISGKTIKELQSPNYIKSEHQFEDFGEFVSDFVDLEDKNDYWTLAGYNINFDIGFLKDWFFDNNAGKDFYKIFHYKSIDVFPLAITLNNLKIIDTKDDKLKTMCEYFDIKINAHNALSDIEATKKLYELIADKYFKKVPTLREIESAIKDWYIRKGYKKGKGNWRFSLHMHSKQNKKRLDVLEFINYEGCGKNIKHFENENADELFKEAYTYFKG